MVKLRIATDDTINEIKGRAAVGFCADDDIKSNVFIYGNAVDICAGTCNLIMNVFDTLPEIFLKQAFVMTLMQEFGLADEKDYDIIGRLVEKTAKKREEKTA